MIIFKDKKVCFLGRGSKIDKDELDKYIIQNEAILVNKIDEAKIIIEGKFTPPNLEDSIYECSKNGVEVYSIDSIEKEFSKNLDIDSILMAIKISKDKHRLIKLLKNNYFDDEIFLKLLKLYDFENDDLYDSDENRDVCTMIVERFCELAKTNHNIQHSPIGIYYTALESLNPKLLEIIYNMPNYKISQKNAQKNQPISLKEVVALNPNSSKVLQLQILKNRLKNELIFLAANESISNSIKKQLFNLDDEKINKALINSGNFDEEMVEKFLKDKELKKELLKVIKLDNQLFENIINDINDIEIIYLSTNKSLTSEMIDIIFEKNIDNANINLLKNSNCSKIQLDRFIKENDKVYNIAMAHNENLDDHEFNKLFHVHDLDVNISLAQNKSAPQEILKQLALLNNQLINESLCANETTPISILLQFQFDGGLKPILSNNETFRKYTRNIIGM